MKKQIFPFAIMLFGLFIIATSCLAIQKQESPLELYPAIGKFLSGGNNKTEHSHSNTFWDNTKQGWFYYETIPMDDEAAEKEEDTVPTIQIDWDAFKKLQANEIREMLKELKDFAVTYTTPQNVANYMVAQKISVKKAQNFMTVWQDVLDEHPALDTTVERPPTGYVSFQLENAKAAEKERAVERLARDTNVGLIFFYSDQNYYSVIQKPVLRNLLSDTKWEPYLFIDVDQNPKAIDQYGIETLPEIWLMLQNGARARVTAGARTADRIKEKIIAAYEKLTGEEMFPDPYTFMENELSEDLDLND